MRFLALILSLIPGLAFAKSQRVTDYKTASCTLSKGEQILSETKDIALMTLVVENHLGRFVQQTWQDGGKSLQYQLLIEDDETSKDMDSFVILQNRKVDGHEVSAEFGAKEIQFVQISNEEYKVRCTLPHE